MTSLLKMWLNEEIKLTKEIDRIEADFANGYLMGQLLYK